MINQNSAESTAIYYYNNKDKMDIIKQLSGIADINPSESCIFSSWGKRMHSLETYDDDMHYLALLNPSFKKAYIFKKAVPLPAGIPLYSILGTLLLQMGEDAELYIQPWFTTEQLQESLPSVTIEKLSGMAKDWICLRASRKLHEDIKRFDSIYPKLLDGHDYKLPDVKLIYSMHWALETSSIMRIVFPNLSKVKPLRVLDVGGSTGFFAFELATMGHTVTNLEKNSDYLQHMLWLKEVFMVSNQVDGRAGLMEDLIADNRERASYDIICFMGSLLLCKREKVAPLLEQAISMLKPGGFIVFRENFSPNQSDARYSKYNRFTVAEFNSFLEGTGQALSYYDHYGSERKIKELKESWMIYAVIQKAIN